MEDIVPSTISDSGKGSGVPASPKPAVAIISNSQTPYRLHLHRRIAAELTEIRLFSVYTHETSNSTWEFVAPAEIGPVSFGKGESALDQGRLDRSFREWRRGGRVIRWMRQNDVRFVVMMGYNDAGRMRIIRWCHRHAVPCFLFGDSNINGDVTRGMKAVLKQLVVGWVVRTCAGVLPCGSLGRAYFMKYGADPAKIFYFPYEPDYGMVRDVPATVVAAVAERFGLSTSRHRLMYSGRLVGVKRVDVLIDAFVAVADQIPDWDLLIVGDGPLKPDLLARVPGQYLDRIKWTGFVDNQAVVSAAYRLSDVLVLPSDYEPWALVINEAAAAGLAIISSSAVGASAEILQDGVNGRVFPKGNVDALINCIKDVTLPETLAAMKAASPAVLADWRRRGDPVNGLRAALRSVDIIR